MLSGSRRLHRGIEGQDIGLEGDLIDHLDDLGDVGRGFVDLGHRPDHVLHLAIALDGVAPGLAGQVIGLVGIDRILFRLGRNLGDRGVELLDRAGLFRCALGQGLAAVRDLA